MAKKSSSSNKSTNNKSSNNTNSTNTNKSLTKRDEHKRQLRDKLNSKQLCFCHNYILESSTAVEAYLTAYPRSNI